MNYSTYAPGERLIIRDEEWLVRRSDTTSSGAQALTVVGISPLVQGQERVYIHGEKEREAREAAMKNGLVLDDASSNMLEELYAALGK